MKKAILLLILICTIQCILKAQDKPKTELPDTVKLKLTAFQIQAIANKIDSLQTTLTMTSTMPSVTISLFNQRVNAALAPIWNQVRQQLVADKPKPAKQ